MRLNLAYLLVGSVSLAYAIPVEPQAAGSASLSFQVDGDSGVELSSTVAKPSHVWDSTSPSPLARGERVTMLDARGALSSLSLAGKTKLAVTVTIPVSIPQSTKTKINKLVKGFLTVYRPLSNFEIELKDDPKSSQGSGSASFKVKIADKVQEWVVDYVNSRITEVKKGGQTSKSP
ncbi:hypothetical protein GGU10DRAFT_375810 [Lentinula aff. detonsa]|uniref:Uncharacterized protein n=2 Tax=Lentinula TaxID=5352 RepID=A0AA38KW62_9AGAR|nr:hypothetical protein GGU10DRAFT_375810 [Lentinula aff. detonsa]KAJ3981349.1 hypothetical protein F5890DRAFT_1536188 [Lentinula detonsa]